MNQIKINNRKSQKTFRKKLRNNLTPAEAFLWMALKDKALLGRKFRRQHSIGKYVVDFYCPSEKLVIELDGADHFTPEGEKYDQQRDAFLASLEITVLRFENEQVFENLSSMLQEITDKFR